MSERLFKRVFLIGVDGAGAFFKDTATPNIDRIMKNGASTYEAITAIPSISAQCWGSMLIGVEPDIHKLTNGYVEANVYPTDSPFPTVFRRIKEKYPDAVLASFSNWDPINHGIVEHNLDVTFASEGDDDLTVLIERYLDENDPTFLFVQFDSVDGAGHRNGYGTEGHLSQITLVDSYIGRIYDKLASRGLIEDALFIVTADHGGTPGGDHGGVTDAELKVYFAATGSEVVENGTIGEMRVCDIPAVVLHALGIDVPEFDVDGFTAQVPNGIFKGYTAVGRKRLPPIRFEHVHKPTPVGTLGDFVDESKVESALFFDMDTGDVTGKHETSVNGTVKFYETGLYGQCAELGMRGSVVLPDVKLGTSSFTVSMWINRDGSLNGMDPSLYGTLDRAVDEVGMSFSYQGVICEFMVFNEKRGLDFVELQLPSRLENGWFNTTLVVDREANTVTHYINFKNPKTEPMNESVRGVSFDGCPFTVGNDTSGTDNNYVNMFMDDFILFNCALSEDEVKKLGEYYKQ